jgi:tRNA dimethylallyltransferase
VDTYQELAYNDAMTEHDPLMNKNHCIMDKRHRPLVAVIAGPTCVGKSDVAAQLCKFTFDSQCTGETGLYPGLIVSADSVQAYRGVQIGANKPSKKELQQTPHLLLDVADHNENYNAAEWTRDAITAIRLLTEPQSNENYDSFHHSQPSINEDKQMEHTTKIFDEVQAAKLAKSYDASTPVFPVVVGGTMMYLQWLVYGRPDAMRPSSSAAHIARSLVDKFHISQDWEGAVKAVASYGPLFSDRCLKLCGKDWYRLRRILEVALTVSENGKDMDENTMRGLYQGQRDSGLASLGYDVRCFFLCPDDRMKHACAIGERCEKMLLLGLLHETTDLCLSEQLPDMAAKAIGYRQTLGYLQREDPRDGDEDAFVSYLSDFTSATRRYAKKQMQWFRKDDEFVFIQVPLQTEREERTQVALAEILRLLMLPRAAYDKELRAESSSSASTRRNNELQGKQMKTFQFQRQILLSGTKDLEAVLVEADACTNRIQAKKRKSSYH